jgi:hypothetical protein
MGALLEGLEITFEVQRKRSNAKMIRKKKTLPLFFIKKYLLFSSLWTLPTFKHHNCLISYSFQVI